jgi:hypothetical protein
MLVSPLRNDARRHTVLTFFFLSFWQLTGSPTRTPHGVWQACLKHQLRQSLSGFAQVREDSSYGGCRALQQFRLTVFQAWAWPPTKHPKLSILPAIISLKANVNFWGLRGKKNTP